jgi:hypothetical protein
VRSLWPPERSGVGQGFLPSDSRPAHDDRVVGRRGGLRLSRRRGLPRRPRGRHVADARCSSRGGWLGGRPSGRLSSLPCRRGTCDRGRYGRPPRPCVARGGRNPGRAPAPTGPPDEGGGGSCRTPCRGPPTTRSCGRAAVTVCSVMLRTAVSWPRRSSGGSRRARPGRPLSPPAVPTAARAWLGHRLRWRGADAEVAESGAQAQRPYRRWSP